MAASFPAKLRLALPEIGELYLRVSESALLRERVGLSKPADDTKPLPCKVKSDLQVVHFVR